VKLTGTRSIRHDSYHIQLWLIEIQQIHFHLDVFLWDFLYRDFIDATAVSLDATMLAFEKLILKQVHQELATRLSILLEDKLTLALTYCGKDGLY